MTERKEWLKPTAGFRTAGFGTGGLGGGSASVSGEVQTSSVVDRGRPGIKERKGD